MDQEIRFRMGVAAVCVCWTITAALVGLCVMTDELRFGAVGLCWSALGAALLVIQDNCKTRRVMRAVARDIVPPVHAVRER